MPTTLDILDAPQRFASFVPKMIAADETRSWRISGVGTPPTAVMSGLRLNDVLAMLADVVFDPTFHVV